jgi:hypothetical protein
MKKEEKFSLVEGTFKADEAKEILQNLYAQKIKFHQLKNFSSHLRFGVDDVVSLNRITALKKNLAEIEVLLAEASASNLHLTISSEVKISLSAEKKEDVPGKKISYSN